MEKEKPNKEPITLNIAYYAMLLTSAIVPWILLASFGWFAAIISWFILVGIFDYLFVPKGSICMGIPFFIPLSSFICLVLTGVIKLVKLYL